MLLEMIFSVSSGIVPIVPLLYFTKISKSHLSCSLLIVTKLFVVNLPPSIMFVGSRTFWVSGSIVSSVNEKVNTIYSLLFWPFSLLTVISLMPTPVSPFAPKAEILLSIPSINQLLFSPIVIDGFLPSLPKAETFVSAF